MSTPPNLLAEKIYTLAARLPEALIASLVTPFLQEKPVPHVSQFIATLPHPAIQAEMESLIHLWQTEHPDIHASGLALAFLTATHAARQHREAQSLELVWTGPRSPNLPLRRTDQALLQLIQEAQTRLWIISFAVYKAQPILDALLAAAQRGVTVSLLLETPDSSADKISFDPLLALGEELRAYAHLYVWPKEKRALSPDGKHGSLHAKAAIADGQTLLISSANLTEYAMNLNMELGVLIRGGALPGQVEGHFEELRREGIVVVSK
ncbi:MAG: phospholipase [Anaerolineales bacterium]|nr:phospholipase [Anaerolineales bacterium]